MKRQLIVGVVIGGVALIGALGAWRWFERASMETVAEKSERKVLYWHDPMVPGFRSDKPGKSPFMDMELVPVYEGDEAASVVSIRPEVAANIGIRTQKATRVQASRRIDTQGYLVRDGGALRVLVDLFDRDAEAVRAGQSAELRVPARPEKTWKAVVERVDSDVDVGLRTLKATLRVVEADASLKPNLYTEVTIQTVAPGARLLIPREALIRTGKRSAVVRVLGEGRFQPVNVIAGTEYGDRIEILRGLAEGDEVVTSGQFLIDSEASVRTSFERMQATEPKP